MAHCQREKDDKNGGSIQVSIRFYLKKNFVVKSFFFFFLVLSRTTVQGNKIRTRGYSKSLVGGFGDGLLHKAEPLVLKEGEGIIVFNSTSSLGYCG